MVDNVKPEAETPGRVIKTQQAATEPKKRGRPPGPGKRRPEYEATLAEVRRLRKLGHSYAQIGEVLGFTRQGVKYYVDKFPEHVCPCCGREKHKPKKKK